MSKVITAKVYIRDTCDPDVPGDCAPVFRVEGAAEIEGLVAEHGIAFEEPLQELEETFADDLAEDQEVPGLVLNEIPSDEPECPLEPDRDWDESVCGEIERRILSRVLGG